MAEALSILATILSSGAGGGLLGFLGSAFKQAQTLKVLKEQNRHAEILERYRSEERFQEAQHELAMADKAVQRAESEGRIAHDLADMDVFKEGMKNKQDWIASGVQWLDGLRLAVMSFVRPAITLYLLYVATELNRNVGLVVGGLDGLPAETIVSLYTQITAQTFTLAGIATGWWFHSRPSRIQLT